MFTCTECSLTYKTKHTVCNGGTCDFCKKHYQNLNLHKCAVRKLFADLDTTTKIPIYCEGCLLPFYSKKFIFAWKEHSLCVNCCHIPEIQMEQIFLRNILHCHLIFTGQMKCEFCLVQVLGYDLQPLMKFELDHINSLRKSHSVGMMILLGFKIHEILKEMQLCRILCLSCHSAVTEIEIRSGILRCKDTILSLEEENSIMQRIDSAAKKLILKREVYPCIDRIN